MKLFTFLFTTFRVISWELCVGENFAFIANFLGTFYHFHWYVSCWHKVKDAKELFWRNNIRSF